MNLADASANNIDNLFVTKVRLAIVWQSLRIVVWNGNEDQVMDLYYWIATGE